MKFAIGEVCIFAIARDPIAFQNIGDEVTVYAIGPYSVGSEIYNPMIDQVGIITREADYVVMREIEPQLFAAVKEWQLRKKDHPSEPDAMTRIHDKELETC